MLNLLPVKSLITVIAALFGLSLVASVYAGFIGVEGPINDAQLVVRFASFFAFGLTVVSYLIWRWIPAVQGMIFPYLGGTWSGKLEYSGLKGSGTRSVTLEIRHTLLKMVLVLDSRESTSRTLAVQAERDVGVNQDKLYYVYCNERKAGFSGAGTSYKGLAIMRVHRGDPPTLHGNYFAEGGSSGMIRLRRKKATAWWKLWR